MKNLLKSKNIQHDLRMSLFINVDSIDDNLCDAVEYAVKNISNIDKVMFILEFKHAHIHNSMSRLLHIFDGIDSIQLITPKLSKQKYYAISNDESENIITFFLQNLSTKKLFLDIDILKNTHIVEIINDNSGITSISVQISSLSDLENVCIPKIYEVFIQINDANKPIEKNSFTKLFQSVPNLSSLKIDIVDKSIRSSDQYLKPIKSKTLIEIMNFIKSKKNSSIL